MMMLMMVMVMAMPTDDQKRAVDQLKFAAGAVSGGDGMVWCWCVGRLYDDGMWRGG